MSLLIPNRNTIPAVQGDCGKGDFGTPQLRSASGYIRRFAASLAFHLPHPLDLWGVVIRYLVVLASISWLHSIFKPHLIGEGHSFTEQFCTGTACRTLFETATDSIWSTQINRLGWIEHFNNMQNHSRDFQQISECCHFLVKWKSHYIRLSYMIIPITNLVEHQKTYLTTWPMTWNLLLTQGHVRHHPSCLSVTPAKLQWRSLGGANSSNHLVVTTIKVNVQSDDIDDHLRPSGRRTSLHVFVVRRRRPSIYVRRRHFKAMSTSSSTSSSMTSTTSSFRDHADLEREACLSRP